MNRRYTRLRNSYILFQTTVRRGIGSVVQAWLTIKSQAQNGGWQIVVVGAVIAEAPGIETIVHTLHAQHPYL